MRMHAVLLPLGLVVALAGGVAAPRPAAAQTNDTAQTQEKPHGGALKGAAAGGAVSKLSGGSATKGAAVGGAAGAIEKHHSKKKIAEQGHD